jgi:hypothetical protein
MDADDWLPEDYADLFETGDQSFYDDPFERRRFDQR